MSGNQGNEPTRKQRREQARAERRALEVAQQAKAAQRKRLLWSGGGAVLLIVVVVVLIAALGGSKSANNSSNKAKPSQSAKTAPLSSLGKLVNAPSQGELGPEEIPIPQAKSLTGTASKANGETVDGIECSSSEQTLFHIHAHLTLFVGGVARQVPYGIGIPEDHLEQTPRGPFVATGRCFYWLHTHAADGIVHIESPVERQYTLGNFFDIWKQPLSSTQVGPAKGKVTAFYNGQVFLGEPRNIPLTAHAQIQLDVSTPLVAPVSLASFGGL